MNNTKDKIITKNDKNQTNKKENTKCDNRIEKLIIICLVIISFILLYVSLFYIHYIIDRGTIEDSATGNIENPDNTDDNKNGSGDSDVIIDNTSRFKILQNKSKNGDNSVSVPWSELKQLDIFNNAYFNYASIIAPGVSGSYNFTVENASESKFIYDVKFTEENNYNVNLKFKLKVNGKYVVGDENTYVDFANLDRENTYINSKSSDIYTIEWKWIDAENDTIVGTTNGANYKMFIKVTATQITD